MGRSRRHTKRLGDATAIGVVAAALAVGGGAPASAATLHTVSAHSGVVTARLSYRGSAAMNNFSALRLTIARGAKVVYDQPVAATECARQCWPGALPPAVPLHVVNLQRAREAAVVLDLYTGGAHCCSVGEVFSWDAGTSTYRQAEHDFGDPGYRLIDLSRDGRREFVSADDRFAYQFTAYAFSGLPLQVWRFAGAFTDVTRRYPRQVARDARGWLQRFRAAARQGQGLGYLAAWAADEELLHRDAAVRRELRRDLKAHLLRSTVGGPGNGSRYIAALRAFLHRAGYR